MITICEPQVRGFSHEKVNSGFIYGLRLAFPEDKIYFYADESHLQAIQKILLHDGIELKNIEYIPIQFYSGSSIRALAGYYFLLKKIFNQTVGRGEDKIFFLSFSASILYLIKKLKPKFSHLKFAFVLHGSFETIADDQGPVLALPRTTLPSASAKKKLHGIRLVDLPRKVWNFAMNRVKGIQWGKFFTVKFSEKEMLLWKHTDDYHYVALSPHATVNAAKYLDVNYLNFYSVVLPTVFAAAKSQPVNDYPKFATFGYGNSLMLHNILWKLSQRKVTKPYEIRIIGMDARGTEGFSNVTCPGGGKPLDRSEMEKFAEDVDAFLILYDKSRYRLTCSGSMLESLSYVKPILHFDNDCVNHFNHEDLPIGIRSNTLDEFVEKMVEIIENYPKYREEFARFRQNILTLRNKCSIESSVSEIRNSFTW